MKTLKLLLISAFSTMLLAPCSMARQTGPAAMYSAVLIERGVNVEQIKDETDFVNAIKKSGLPAFADTLNTPRDLTLNEAVSHAVLAAGMSELAATFKQEKSQKILASYHIASQQESINRTLAAALTTGLIDSSWLTKAQKKKQLAPGDLSYLLQAALDFQGIKASYLGRTSDPSIYRAINESWNNYNIVRVPELIDIVDKAVIKGVVTGYNILDTRDNPNFNPALSVIYGHSNIKHALQLVALLQSEGIDAKVDFQGKTSAYVYLEEWGTPVESDTFKVKKIPSGNYVAYAKEYNLAFEFKSAADKMDFNRIIIAYAKKDSKDEPGLIYGSWWQPLYYSNTQMGKGYLPILDHVISYGLYEAHPFSLKRDGEKVVKEFLKINAKLNIKSREFWVNQAFFNYLEGKSK